MDDFQGMKYSQALPMKSHLQFWQVSDSKSSIGLFLLPQLTNLFPHNPVNVAKKSSFISALLFLFMSTHYLDTWKDRVMQYTYPGPETESLLS